MKKNTIPIIFLLGLSLLGLGFTGAPIAYAKATTVTTNLKIPIALPVFIPCALDGVGEEVKLTGNLHVLMHITFDDNGGIHAKTHFQPQGISGIGEDSGDKYQGTGVTQTQFNGKVGVEVTFVNNFRMIGQGKGNNFLVHETFHITVNANGDATASVDNFTTDCK